MSKYQIQNCIHGPMLQGKGIIRTQALRSISKQGATRNKLQRGSKKDEVSELFGI